jgi:hypothetical protein
MRQSNRTGIGVLAAPAETRYFGGGGQNPKRSEPHTSPFSAAKRENVMRRVMILISVAAVAIACAKKEAPPVDTGTAMAPAAAPALTDADVSGTWKGTSTPMESDSVMSRWTMVCGAGKCTGTIEGSKDPYIATYTISGDSTIGVSQPYSDPAVKGGKVIDTWVGHFSGANVTGTGAAKLASKPDSVVSRYRWSGTRTQ